MDSGKMEKSAETIKPSDQGLESEGDDYIHVDEPGHKSSKIGPGFHDAPTEDLGPNGGNTADEGGWIDERGYGVPILASDEVAKEAGAEYMQPAISPYQERRGSSTFFHPEGETPGCKSGDRTPSVSGSRPTSRPASIHGVGTSLARFASRNEEREDMHTPLENVEEYEPLFPDEEDESGSKPLNAADRFKMRPGTLKRRFPSQDIWEDAPNSLQHYATVSTPELPQPAKTFEKPETEAAREEEASEAERTKLMPKEERLSKSVFHPQLRDDMPTRPDMKQRFPSRDIWEDSPDSLHLVTTVSTPDVEEPRSPPIASKPAIPPRPTKSKLGEGSSEQGLPVQSQVPSRPPKRLHQVPPADAKLTTIENGAEKQVSPTEGRKAPIIPDRPKPQVPARPSKPKPTGSSEDLTKTTSAGSAGSVSPTITKAKPVVPARPTGSKIAALQAGFMTDLNKRLQIGPQAPKPVEREVEPEAEVEKVPLSDARKGRARGPVRRKPATEASPEKSVPKITISPPKMVWSIGEDGGVSMRQEEKAALKAVEEAKTARVESTTQPSEVPSGASALATNTAGDTVDPAPAPEKVEEPPAPVSEKSDVPVADQLRPDLATTSAASSTSKLFKTADQTPAEEIEDPLATVPTASHAAETTTTADNILAATEPEPSPAAVPNPEESKAYISADSPEDAPEDLQRKPTIPREPSLPALATTLSGQKVDAGKASDALEMLDTGVQGGGVEGGEEKSAEEVDMMSHRGSVTIAETGSLARKPEGEA
jgi:Altered inheritance of mitochondria protein 21